MNTQDANIVARAKIDWASIAQEQLDIHMVGGALYAFGSELATLRLLKHYRHVAVATHAFSTNLNEYYFCLDIAQ